MSECEDFRNQEGKADGEADSIETNNSKTNNMKQEEVFKTSDSMLAPNTTPFSVTFSWQGQSITVQLEKGEDVLKLAKIFSDFLSSNYIHNKIINK
jgi:hypothetical protein